MTKTRIHFAGGYKITVTPGSHVTPQDPYLITAKSDVYSYERKEGFVEMNKPSKVILI